MRPDADRPLSQAEAAHRLDFALASTWAKAALEEDDLRPFYEALGKQRDIPARAAAISDFLKRPSLEALDLSDYAGQAGGRIYFMATDNAGVANAMVSISDGDKFVYEEGSPVFDGRARPKHPAPRMLKAIQAMGKKRQLARSPLIKSQG